MKYSKFLWSAHATHSICSYRGWAQIEAGARIEAGQESTHCVCLGHLKCRLEVRTDCSMICGDWLNLPLHLRLMSTRKFYYFPGWRLWSALRRAKKPLQGRWMSQVSRLNCECGNFSNWLGPSRKSSAFAPVCCTLTGQIIYSKHS